MSTIPTNTLMMRAWILPKGSDTGAFLRRRSRLRVERSNLFNSCGVPSLLRLVALATLAVSQVGCGTVVA
jgi:hypothetical protein